jgi:hypothetical protein
MRRGRGRRGTSRARVVKGRSKTRAVGGPGVAHLLLKYSPTTADTIGEHAAILQRHGRVMLGKFGTPVSTTVQKWLNTQIQRGTPTLLFLTRRDNDLYRTHRCRLEAVQPTLSSSDQHLVPRYYRNATIHTWFRLVDIRELGDAEMKCLYVISSGRPVMSVVTSSSTSFIVAISKSPVAELPAGLRAKRKQLRSVLRDDRLLSVHVEALPDTQPSG